MECDVGGGQQERDEEWVTRSEYYVQVSYICGDLPPECVGFVVLLRSAVTQRACASECVSVRTHGHASVAKKTEMRG